MEMLDSDDQIKGQLMRKSIHHREQLEEDVKLISERTEKIITNALIIGAALAATYFLVSRFSDSKVKSKPKTRKVKLVKEEEGEAEEVVVQSVPEIPGIITQIGTALASQATVLLLNLAKEKLGEFLQAQSGEKKENLNGNS
jgi:hypothetical protein